MARSRREFTPEYKDEAVKLVFTTGRAVATVARELGINEATLGRWVTAFKDRNETQTLQPLEGAMVGSDRHHIAKYPHEFPLPAVLDQNQPRLLPPE